MHEDELRAAEKIDTLLDECLSRLPAGIDDLVRSGVLDGLSGAGISSPLDVALLSTTVPLPDQITEELLGLTSGFKVLALQLLHSRCRSEMDGEVDFAIRVLSKPGDVQLVACEPSGKPVLSVGVDSVHDQAYMDSSVMEPETPCIPPPRPQRPACPTVAGPRSVKQRRTSRDVRASRCTEALDVGEEAADIPSLGGGMPEVRVWHDPEIWNEVTEEEVDSSTLESGHEPPTILCVAEKPAIARAIATALVPRGTRFWKEPSAAGASVPVFCLEAPWASRNPSALSRSSTPLRFRITSTFGHIYNADFPAPLRKWGQVNPERLFDADVERVQPDGGRGRLPEHFAAEAAQSHALVLWLDCDREGESICFEVLEHVIPNLAAHPWLPHSQAVPADVKESDYRSDPRIWRARFSSLAPHDLRYAFSKLQKPNPWDAWAVQARQIIDLKVGVAFTRMMTQTLRNRVADLAPERKGGPLISYGPCQTPTLCFCTSRWDRIQRFKADVSYTIEVDVVAFSTGESVRLQWDPPGKVDWQGHADVAVDHRLGEDGAEIEPPRSQTRFSKMDVEQRLKEFPPFAKAVVASCKHEEREAGRPLALNTVAMLKAASRELGMDPHTCMQLAEKLYLSGFLTYPRTETTHYPSSMDCVAIVKDHWKHWTWGPWCQQLLQGDLQQPPRGEDRGDHPPITPVKCASPQQVEQAAGADGARLYELVVRRFLASISPNVRYVHHHMRFRIGQFDFSLQGNEVISEGFQGICPGAVRQCLELQEKKLLQGVGLMLAKGAWLGEEYDVQKVGAGKVESSPPLLLTEADLIGLMEKHCIGTDASMPQHVKNIVERGYVELQEPGRRMRPTALGCALVHGLRAIDKELVKPAVRARIERDVAAIARQRCTYEEVVVSALATFRKQFCSVRGGMQRLIEQIEIKRCKWRAREETASPQKPRARSRSPRTGKGNETEWSLDQLAIVEYEEREAFEVGATVEYFSKSNGFWMLSTVIGKYKDGKYKLTVKSVADDSKMRRAPPLEMGDPVMICVSRDRDDWVSAFVAAVDIDGTYDIAMEEETKKSVKLEYLRHVAHKDRFGKGGKKGKGGKRTGNFNPWRDTAQAWGPRNGWSGSWTAGAEEKSSQADPICWNFKKKGFCKMGNKCKWLHTIRPGPAPQ